MNLNPIKEIFSTANHELQLSSTKITHFIFYCLYKADKRSHILVVLTSYIFLYIKKSLKLMSTYVEKNNNKKCVVPDFFRDFFFS